MRSETLTLNVSRKKNIEGSYMLRSGKLNMYKMVGGNTEKRMIDTEYSFTAVMFHQCFDFV